MTAFEPVIKNLCIRLVEGFKLQITPEQSNPHRIFRHLKEIVIIKQEFEKKCLYTTRDDISKH